MLSIGRREPRWIAGAVCFALGVAAWAEGAPDGSSGSVLVAAIAPPPPTEVLSPMPEPSQYVYRYEMQYSSYQGMAFGLLCRAVRREFASGGSGRAARWHSPASSSDIPAASATAGDGQRVQHGGAVRVADRHVPAIRRSRDEHPGASAAPARAPDRRLARLGQCPHSADARARHGCNHIRAARVLNPCRQAPGRAPVAMADDARDGGRIRQVATARPTRPAWRRYSCCVPCPPGQRRS